MTKTLMLCSCDNTQTLDRDGIEAATGLKCSRVFNGLCTSDLEQVVKTLPAGDTMIACGQQAELFTELAAELGADAPLTIDIRDRAGWSKDAKKATPKMAALIADAQLIPSQSKLMDVHSDGVCLIIGPSDVALNAARQLSQTLSVTVLLADTPELSPFEVEGFDILVGNLKSATGSLGNFAVKVDQVQTVDPSGRGFLKFTAPRDGGSSDCDVILDLSGKPALFSASDKRDGYFRADPADPIRVADQVLAASHMVGTFEKPLYVSYDAQLCAHSRASQTGCDRCLNVCPTGAILPAGDSVTIDPNICAGCGSCAAVCPSGAVSYDDPSHAFSFNRIQTLAKSYRDAGGKHPRLLVHDETHGRDMIRLSARFGQGLPADVIPMEVGNLAGFGHTEILTAFTAGFSHVDILVGPKTEKDALEPQLQLAQSLMSGLDIETDVVRMLDLNDPDQLSDKLYEPTENWEHSANPILSLGARRDVTRLAMKALAGDAPSAAPIPLPADAPYGAVLVDSDACTLCLSCASLCPTGALGDNPDKPQLTFKEDACLQCGICVSTCPETAISLVPQFDMSDAALRTKVVHEEEPFECIECGKPFGVRSTIERIVEKLEGKHSMFVNSDNTRLIRMCDDCRVTAQFRSDQPMAGGDRPAVRRTEDYLKDRKPN